MQTASWGATTPTVQLLRKTSSGLAGTYANAKCHAQPLIPLIDFLVKEIPSWKVETWFQGHNVHVLQSNDSRKFVLRPLAIKGSGYVGMSLALRISRTLEIPLADVFADSPGTWGDFSRMMKMLITPPIKSEAISPQE